MARPEALRSSRQRRLDLKRSIFSELARREELLLVDRFAVDTPKTKQLVGKLVLSLANLQRGLVTVAL